MLERVHRIHGVLRLLLKRKLVKQNFVLVLKVGGILPIVFEQFEEVVPYLGRGKLLFVLCGLIDIEAFAKGRATVPVLPLVNLDASVLII